MRRLNAASELRNRSWRGSSHCSSMWFTQSGKNKKIERAFAHDLIGEVEVIGARVPGLGGHRPRA